MKRVYRTSLSAGLALALMTGPLAMAQQAPQYPNNMSPPAMQPSMPNTEPGTMGHPMMAPSPMGHPETSPMSHPESGPSPTSHPEMSSSPTSHPMMTPSPTEHGSMQGSMQGTIGMSHPWHEGDHYYGSRVVVNDWNHYHLHRPDSGYEWVRSGDQFVLIVVATGVIAGIAASAMSQ